MLEEPDSSRIPRPALNLVASVLVIIGNLGPIIVDRAGYGAEPISGLMSVAFGSISKERIVVDPALTDTRLS